VDAAAAAATTEARLDAVHAACAPRLDALRRYTALRRALAPAVEALLLADRACFLREATRGGVCARVEQLFLPTVSPRCFALVAHRRSSSSAIG